MVDAPFLCHSLNDRLHSGLFVREQPVEQLFQYLADSDGHDGFNSESQKCSEHTGGLLVVSAYPVRAGKDTLLRFGIAD